MKSEFRPCPFCGSHDIYNQMETICGWPNYITIRCNNCGALMTFFNEDDRSIADVINRYNHRAGEYQ